MKINIVSIGKVVLRILSTVGIVYFSYNVLAFISAKVFSLAYQKPIIPIEFFFVGLLVCLIIYVVYGLFIKRGTNVNYFLLITLYVYVGVFIAYAEHPCQAMTRVAIIGLFILGPIWVKCAKPKEKEAES